MPTFDQVLEARDRIAAYVHHTPVMTSEYLNQLTGAELFFKCENLQRSAPSRRAAPVTPCFRPRTMKQRRGVVTHSSGNHAGALCYAARRRGIAATVVMPRGAGGEESRGRKLRRPHRRVRADPGRARSRRSRALVAESGANAVHPYDDAPRDRRPGHLRARAARARAGSRHGGRARRRRRPDLRHLPEPVRSLAPKSKWSPPNRPGGDDAWLSLQPGSSRRRPANGRRRTQNQPQTEHLALRRNSSSDILLARRDGNHRRHVPDLAAHENHHRTVVGGTRWR